MVVDDLGERTGAGEVEAAGARLLGPDGHVPTEMQFCDDCGSMMKAEDDVMVCTNCGATAERDTAAGFVSTETQADTEVVETEEGMEFEGKPTTSDTRCPDCGHEEAYYAFLQTAAADEAPTRFLKCTECGNRWREYN